MLAAQILVYSKREFSHLLFAYHELSSDNAIKKNGSSQGRITASSHNGDYQLILNQALSSGNAQCLLGSLFIWVSVDANKASPILTRLGVR